MKTKINFNIAVIGLGYVGLPLAIEFGKFFNIVGIDIDKKLINNLKNNIDKNNFIKKNDFKKSKYIKFSHNYNDISNCNIYIITLPTPVNEKNKPDLTIIKKSLKKISFLLKKNDFIIFESTVFPGATEEEFIPLIEKFSKLKNNLDFSVGYSPERINPGDKKHTLTKITKIISSNNNFCLKVMKSIYGKIISKKLYVAPSIKVAESAKVIENTQRDINVAFINELSVIFNKLNINTYEVLKAANTKWNFLDFQPGLVGGHCIGVDPYYLSYKSLKTGYKPNMILSGRKINDDFPIYISKTILNILKKNYKNLQTCRILILGYTFKENCNDFRNTQVRKILNYFIKKNLNVHFSDPYLKRSIIDVKYKKYFREYINLDLLKYNFIILAVGHNQFKKINLRNLYKNRVEIFDIKNFFNKKYISYSL